MNFEFADDGLAWNSGLKSLVEMILDDVAVAIGTLLGQRSVEGFIDVFGQRLAMGVVAMQLALLAARLFGMLFRFAFGEGALLAVCRNVRARRCVSRAARRVREAADFREAVVDTKERPCGTRHRPPCQLHEFIAIFTLTGNTTVNNH